MRNLLEVMVEADVEELTEADRQNLRALDEYCKTGGQGLPFEQTVEVLGFAME